MIIEKVSKNMFNNDKVLHSICYILKNNNNKINLLKLMKLLYLADRNSIKKTLQSISGDNFISMKYGPVLSNTLNILYSLKDSDWGEYLRLEKNTSYYLDVVLIKDCSLKKLNAFEINILEEIDKEFKNYNEWEIVDYTHKNIAEWKETKNSKKIRFYEIAKNLGFSDEEIEIAKEEYEELDRLIENGM